MRVFEEKQRFNQWWLYVIFAMILVVILIGIYENTDGLTNFQDPALVLLLLAGTLPMILINGMQLETRIDNEGIRVKYRPFGFSEKFFSWKEIQECYVRKYRPVLEYGGWGIRGSGNKKAYNVSGNLGIQIVTRDKKTFLIGTKKPEAARAVVKTYEHKTYSKTNTY